MDHRGLIDTFYHAFTARDAERMIGCYHENITFHDPAFGTLEGEEARSMWRMLLERGGSSLLVRHSNIHETATGGTADWTASYPYGPKKRMVTNRIHATFEIENGRIVRHTDSFNLWKWSRQALGLPGLLLGWSPFMRNKIRQRTNALLKRYMQHTVDR